MSANFGPPEITYPKTGDVVGQASFLELPRFASPPTFAALPRVDQVSDYDAGVLGIPFDAGVTFRPGARFGPAHIRNGSRLLRPYNPDLEVTPFADRQIVDFGDLGVNPFGIQDAVQKIERAVTQVAERADKLLVLGGDHTVSLPVLRALARKHGPIAVLHFDAHLDTWGDYFGSALHHGSPFRRASEEGLLDQEACAHVGIRGSVYGASDLFDDAALGFATTRSEEIQQSGIMGVIEALRSRIGQRPLYVSVDIDVLDPAFAPGTGTPEPGGLTSRELLSILRGLQGSNLIGGDIVEVSPAYDHADITGFAAAHVAYEMASLWAAEKPVEQ
ncbi:agmatinase [Streptomyces sp. NPDC008343]|uniref:agmatinase n=1 Tax=Streptomyces sp. NPDC008343 TaxID=3364828 RepID=UPI0036E51856